MRLPQGLQFLAWPRLHTPFTAFHPSSGMLKPEPSPSIEKHALLYIPAHGK